MRGNALFPTSLGGRFSILFAILRQVALVVSIGVTSSELSNLDPHVIFVDQLSVCVPLFRIIYPRAKVLFYGHYPDRLLAKKEVGAVGYVKKLYRVPFDILEGWSTACADRVAVNSKFTRSVYKATFRSLRKRELRVIYPCVDTETSKPAGKDAPLWPNKKILLSINRFEGKKNVDLAIRAYAALSSEERSRAKLVLAGGFDPRSPENNATHRELQVLSESLKLTHATFRSNDTMSTDLTTDDVDVLFLLSIPTDLKQRLLHAASLLIYTPKDEHFGIVPLEAMLAEVPVLATNTGGPLETIYDGRTGWLRSPDKVEQWTDVMRKPLIPSSADNLRAMGEQGRERVLAEFSQKKMNNELEKEIQSLCQHGTIRPVVLPEWLVAMVLLTIIAVIGGYAGLKFTLWASNLDQDNWFIKELARRANATASSLAESASASASASVTAIRNEL